MTCVGDGKMVPWVLSRSLHPSALVCECMCVRVFVCVYVCVCMYVCVLLVQGQQHDPHHFSPSGLVFSSASPAVPWLTPSLPSHACSHSGPLGRCPSPRPATVKTLRAHLLTLPRSLSCVTPAAPASTLSISLLVCLPPHRARAP